MDYRETMRRMLATLAFRTRHAFRNAPRGFEDFEAGMGVRTPTRILNHVNDCITMTNRVLRGQMQTPPRAVSFMEALEAFHLNLDQLDKTLQEVALPDNEKCLRLFQGPLCDAMTHTGQLMMLRRLMGAAIPGVNYYRADIRSGVVGPDQPLPET